jgi:hypothetical protein
MPHFDYQGVLCGMAAFKVKKAAALDEAGIKARPNPAEK